jgi:hypothetical protein
VTAPRSSSSIITRSYLRNGAIKFAENPFKVLRGIIPAHGAE